MNQVFTLLIALVVQISFTFGDELRDIETEWDAAFAAATSSKDAPLRLEAAGEKLRTWLSQHGPDFKWESEQQRGKLDLIDFHIAKAWARAGDYKKALEHLKQESAPYQESEARFLDNTRNPTAFANDVFSLHSEIMASTGVVAEIPGAGYWFVAVPFDDNTPAFAFAYGSDDEFQSEFFTEGVASDEQKKLICLFAPDTQGRFTIVDRAQVIAERAGFKMALRKSDSENYLVLEGVKKFINYLPTSNYPEVRNSPLSRIELRVAARKVEQPMNAIERMSSPSLNKAPADTPDTALNVTPTLSNADSQEVSKKPDASESSGVATSPTIWAVVAAIGVATIGLLWMLLKVRR